MNVSIQRLADKSDRNHGSSVAINEWCGVHTDLGYKITRVFALAIMTSFQQGF